MSTVARKLLSGTDFKGGAAKRSYTPFTTRTTSPKLQPSSQLHNSDSPRAQLDDERIAPRPAAGEHGQATRARLMEKFSDDTALRRLGEKHAYLQHLNAREPASSELKNEAREIFLSVLEDISGLPGIAGTKARTMQGIGMICITEAALQACANDPAAAARALCCLRNIDLLAGIRHPERMPASVGNPSVRCPAVGKDDGLFHFTEHDLTLAWKIAQELEATPAGFAALKALTPRACTVPDAHPSIGRHDDMMLHAYLQAAREKCGTAISEGFPVSPAPYRIAMIDGAPATVIDKGIAQIRKHLIASHAHIEHAPTAPFAYEARPGEHEWAIGFIRNGLYSDEQTIGGKPSAFAQIEGRLNKVAIWCERATAGNGAGSTAWRKAAPFLLPGHKKSPLNAYNALEAGRGPRKCGVGLENSAQGIIQDARAFKDHIIGNIIKGIKASGGDDGSPLSTRPNGIRPDPSENTIRNLARLALLTETANNTAPFVTLLHGAAPDAYTMEQARQRIYSWLAGGEAAQRQATRDTVEHALSAAARPLTLDRLQEWAAGNDGKAVPASGDMKTTLRPESELHDVFPAAISDASDRQEPETEARDADRPDWTAYANAVRQVGSGIGEPVPAPHLGRLGNVPDRLGVAGSVIESAAARMELGSKLSFTSGGFVGAGTKELTRFLGSFFTLGLARPRIDASAMRKRVAVLEMETSAGGNQIFVGTRCSVKVQGGVGVAVGPAAKIRGVGGFKAGASFDAFASMERPATRGVQLRLPRTQSGGMNGDQTNNILLGSLFRTYVIERNSAASRQDDTARAPGKDGGSTLKNLLQACPELGVGLLKTSESIARKGVSLEAGASVGIGPLSAGPSVGISYEETHAKTLNWIESKAALNLLRSGQGARRTAALTGQIHVLQHVPKTMKTLRGTAAAPVRLKQAVGGLLNAMCVTSKEIGSWGGSGSCTLLIENEAISQASRAATVHCDAESFIASVAPKLDQWAVATAHRFQNEKANAGDAYRQEAYDRAYATLRAQLNDARSNADANTQYTELFELSADALETANALRSAIALFERSANKEQAALYARKLEALLASDDAWVPHLLWAQRITRGEASAGVYFGVYAGKTDAVSSRSIKLLG